MGHRHHRALGPSPVQTFVGNSFKPPNYVTSIRKFQQALSVFISRSPRFHHTPRTPQQHSTRHTHHSHRIRNTHPAQTPVGHLTNARGRQQDFQRPKREPLPQAVESLPPAIHRRTPSRWRNGCRTGSMKIHDLSHRAYYPYLDI